MLLSHLQGHAKCRVRTVPYIVYVNCDLILISTFLKENVQLYTKYIDILVTYGLLISCHTLNVVQLQCYC